MLKKATARIIFSLAILWLLIVAGELFCRFIWDIPKQGNGELTPGDQKLYWINSKGRQVVRNKKLQRDSFIARAAIPITLDPLGIRRQSKQIAQEPGTLVLGDSITFSDYIPDGQDWVSQLSAITNKTLYNAGVADSGTWEQYQRFKEIDRHMKINEIWVVWYLNDSRPPWQWSPTTEIEPVFRYSSLYRNIIMRKNFGKYADQGRIWGRIVDFPEKGWTYPEELEWAAEVKRARFDWGFAWNRHSKIIAKRWLGAIKQHAGSRPVTVIVTPLMMQVEKGLDLRPQDELFQICWELSIRCVDLLPAFEGKPGYFFDQCHYNPAGNKQVAEYLANVL